MLRAGPVKLSDVAGIREGTAAKVVSAAEQVRQAYLVAGDTLGLVVQSRKGRALAVPFQQTVVLQSQLLG